MCRLRQVRNIYLQCGHGVTESDVMVQCENSKCRFSPFHPTSCKQPRCRQTCIQYHSFPEQYSPQLNRLCPMCQNLLASRGRR
ncbi:hypothetical protein CYLTODRAFT_405354 [Cylindrobasidium torrendii FP15055 ss-10]|uniref:Uncharacterized protein n=1 Tax=Cylindrobasidium torrendii FP15055 ss-10 TaxID=1314674 RepID=A0A0D7ATN2_9AGAR|nr:hypothetical protein CYLTODRAFT_405354 [Cylindrobasidium torrendii FP15055 ss-10]